MQPTPYIVWLLPRGKVRVKEQGPTWDFDADVTDPGAYKFRWDDVCRSLTGWVKMARPPILMNHETPTPGAAVPEYGRVLDVFVMTAEEARANGVDAHTLVDSLYARVQPTEALATLRTNGMVGNGSPSLEAGFTDDTGTYWPLTLWEYSHTEAPRMRSRQPHPETLLAISLADDRRRHMARRVKLNDDLLETVADAAGDAAEAAAESPDTPVDTAVSLQTLADAIALLASEFAAFKASMAPDTETVEVEAVETLSDDMQDDQPITLADVRRLVAAERKRDETLAELRRTRVATESAYAALADLRGRDAKAYTALVSALPVRKPGVKVPLADARNGAKEAPSVRANRLVAEKGIKFSEALALINREG